MAGRLMALKRHAVVPAEGLLAEAVLKHVRVVPNRGPRAKAPKEISSPLATRRTGRYRPTVSLS